MIVSRNISISTSAQRSRWSNPSRPSCRPSWFVPSTSAPTISGDPDDFRHLSLTLIVFSKLGSLGIRDAGDYRDGNWRGNSSDESDIFLSVTHSLADLVESYKIHYKTGTQLLHHSRDQFRNLNPLQIRFLTYGRCFQLSLGGRQDNVFFVDLVSRMPLYVFLNLPGQFYHEDARSKLQVNTGESLFLDVTYEVLKINNDPSCAHYDRVSYDKCKLEQVGEFLDKTLGCSVPFMENTTSVMCRNETAGLASKIFKDRIGIQVEACPEPCAKITTFFGFPFISRNGKTTGFCRLYFKNIVKVTEDFISYDLLRWWKYM